MALFCRHAQKYSVPICYVLLYVMFPVNFMSMVCGGILPRLSLSCRRLVPPLFFASVTRVSLQRLSCFCTDRHMDFIHSCVCMKPCDSCALDSNWSSFGNYLKVLYHIIWENCMNKETQKQKIKCCSGSSHGVGIFPRTCNIFLYWVIYFFWIFDTAKLYDVEKHKTANISKRFH